MMQSKKHTGMAKVRAGEAILFCRIVLFNRFANCRPRTV